MAYPAQTEPDDALESSSSFDLKRVYYTLLEKLWVILLCIAAAGVLTWGYLKRAPQVFSATSILQVDSQQTKLMGAADDLRGDDLRSPDALKTIERVLQSRSLYERVIATNNLANDPRFVDPEAAKQMTKEQFISILGSMITVTWQGGTRLINVNVESDHRELPAEIANSLVREFMAQDFEKHSTTTEVATQYLQEKAEELGRKLRDAETALQAYKRSKDSVSLEDKQDIVVQKLKEISTKVANAEADVISLEAEMRQIETAKPSIKALLGITSVANTPGITDLQSKLSQAEVEFGYLTQRYKAKHPKYEAAISQRNQLETAISNAVTKSVQSVRNSYESAKAREADLKKLLEEQKGSVIQLGEQMIKYNELQREVNSVRALYESVVKRQQETAISKQWEDSRVRVVQRAFTPERPIRPDKPRLLAIGLAAGLVLGLLLALALEALDSSIHTPDEAEAYLKLPVLTAVPQLRAPKSGQSEIVMTSQDESFGAEAFRTLRTTLFMLGPEESRRTFLFTSAVPEEGKTFCAINYAYSLAQQGLRTLLIEADLRCPRVERALGRPATKHLGVSDYLVKKASLDAIAQPTEHPALSLIAAGTRSPNPSELLGLNRFNQLIDDALQQFDRVVIDSAPVQPVSDTLLLASRVQTVCLIVRANKTPRKAARRAAHLLFKARAPLAGIIFNRLTQTRGQHYYDYSYYPEYSKTPKPTEAPAVVNG